MEYLNNALEINDDYPEAHIYLGLYYYEKMQFENAKGEFQKGKALAEKLWKDEKGKLKRWTEFAEDAINIIDNKDVSNAKVEINDETIENLRDKIDVAHQEMVQYLIYTDYSSKELTLMLGEMGLSKEEIDIVLENATQKIPDPPDPEEIRELKKPEKKKIPFPVLFRKNEGSLNNKG